MPQALRVSTSASVQLVHQPCEGYFPSSCRHRTGNVPEIAAVTALYYEPLVLYCEVGAIYLLFSSFLSYAQGRLERRLGQKRKRG